MKFNTTIDAGDMIRLSVNPPAAPKRATLHTHPSLNPHELLKENTALQALHADRCARAARIDGQLALVIEILSDTLANVLIRDTGDTETIESYEVDAIVHLRD